MKNCKFSALTLSSDPPGARGEGNTHSWWEAEGAAVLCSPPVRQMWP